MSNFREWRSIIDGVLLPSAIPDSLVERSDDDSSSLTDVESGTVIGTSQEWSKIQVEISSNTDREENDSFTDFKIYEYDLENETDLGLIHSQDVGDFESGDVITFDLDNKLDAEGVYAITIDQTADENRGYLDVEDEDLPIVSDDGDLEILDGIDNYPQSRNRLYHFRKIGNINL